MKQLKLQRDEKRKSGQFYTPEPIVDYMVNSLGLSKNSTVLDSACGCGVFLINTFKYLVNKFNSKSSIKNIYGVDLNKQAIELTKHNLLNLSGERYREIVDSNIQHGNSLYLKCKTFNWKQKFPLVFKQGGFDFIIGNPPYVTVTNRNEYDYNHPIYNAFTYGIVNAATLMTATGYELLKEDGKLVFLLPKSITRVKSYCKLREFLLNNTSICQIYDLGAAFKEVRGEQIILSFKKRKPKNGKISIVKYANRNSSMDKQPNANVIQKDYASFDKFLTMPDEGLFSLAERLNSIPLKLEEVCGGQIFRGIPIRREMQNEVEGNKEILAVSGNLIGKFYLKDRFFLSNLNGYLSKTELMKKNKIIIQNIYSAESGLKAYFDTEGTITSETVTNLIIEKGNPKYIFALMNSKLITFYLTYVIYNGSKLTMHTDREYVGKIPLIYPDKKDEKKIENLIDSIIEDHEQWKEYIKKIDDIIYKIYSVSKEQRSRIDLLLEDIMSKRSYW